MKKHRLFTKVVAMIVAFAMVFGIMPIALGSVIVQPVEKATNYEATDIGTLNEVLLLEEYSNGIEEVGHEVYMITDVQPLSGIIVNTEQGLRDAVLNATPGEPLTIIIENDIMLSSPVITINGGRDITLRGDASIIVTSSSRHFDIRDGSRFTLTDDVILTRDKMVDTSNGGVYVGNGSIFNMDGGAVTNTVNIPGVTVVGSTFNMRGGTISNNVASLTITQAERYGAGVSVVHGSTFNMSAGTIVGNYTDNYFGGGVGVSLGSTFNMSGGSIADNSAPNGGGVFVSEHGSNTFNMSGGIISGNIAERTAGTGGNGGGVGLQSTATVTTTFRLSGGEIVDNKANSAAGVYIVNGGVFEMTGGKIKGNETIASGGGLIVHLNSQFTMFGGEISGNKSGTNAGGVSVSSGSTFKMTDGEISGNEAASSGGGVVIQSNSIFDMIGGEISDNKAGNNGGGVIVSNSVFTMEGGSILANESLAEGGDGGGGGVYVVGNSDFTIINGLIAENSALTDSGGGVHIRGENSNFIMVDGIISNNKAHEGGGVFVRGSSNFTMVGGVISDNIAYDGHGGGVCLLEESVFNMDGGTISNNLADFWGGGVNVQSSIFNMSAGVIADNKAGKAEIRFSGWGGGVFLLGTFNMTGGEIVGNIANNEHYGNGGGVFVFFYSHFNMQDGIITNNTALSNGGGVFVEFHESGPSTLNISGNSFVTGNTAGQEGGGIFITVEDYENLTVLDYQGITIADSVVFSGNRANQLYMPPDIAASYTNIQFASSSARLDGDYLHLINNYDINFVGTELLYFVRYHANGGTGYFWEVKRHNGTHTVLTATAADISKADWVFTGWNTEANGSGTAHMPGDIITITDNINLYAQWELRFTITFVLDGGNVGGNKADIIHNRPAGSVIGAVYIPTPVRDDYNFDGWRESGNGPLLNAEAVAALLVEGARTFVAQWTPIEITEPTEYLPTITKAASPGTVVVGERIRYTITVTNPNETITLENLVVRDPLNTERVTFANNSVRAYVYNSDGTPSSVVGFVYGSNFTNGELLINLNKLPADSYVVISFEVTATSSGEVINTAYLYYNEEEVGRDRATVNITRPGGGGTGGGGGGGTDPGDGNGITPPTPGDRVPNFVVTFTEDHIAYLVGYPDGTIRPNSTITRAEAGTIFFRLLDDSFRTSVWSQSNTFRDVVLTNWFNNAVSTLANANIVEGYPDGTFRPNQSITRAEFAAMIARFVEDPGYEGENLFNDINGHWAEGYINIVGYFGWINGFGDGNFRPNQNITRAEAAAIINRMLERLPENVDDLLPGMVTWPDNMNRNAWFYLYIQEATNSHEFEMKENGVNERWTELKEPRDWTVLERPNSSPGDIL